MEFRADLHCHSTCSDGTLTPKELILLAKKIGLQGISITDHDTIDAYSEAIPQAKESGIEIISGVEFSTIHMDNSVHILGYAFNLNSTEIQTLCQKHQQRRIERNRAILERLTAKGFSITEEEVQSCASIPSHGSKRIMGRPHIAQAMVKKGYVESVQDAFKLYIGEDKPFFVRGELISLEETLQVIHAANGYAIIAHPHLIKNESLLANLLTMKFDGIECYYSQFQSQQHERWIKIAKKKNWLMTGGSDFHGDIKPTIPLGCSWVPEETFRVLQNHFHNVMSETT